MEDSSCGLGLGWGLRSLGVSRHWSVDGGRGVRLNHRGLVVSLDLCGMAGRGGLRGLVGASMSVLRMVLGVGLLDGARMDGWHVVCRSVLGGWLGAIFDIRQCALGWLGLRWCPGVEYDGRAVGDLYDSRRLSNRGGR